MKPHIYFSRGAWRATMRHPTKEFMLCCGQGETPCEAFAWMMRALEHRYER